MTEALSDEALLAELGVDVKVCPSSYKMAQIMGQAKRDFAHLFG